MSIRPSSANTFKQPKQSMLDSSIRTTVTLKNQRASSGQLPAITTNLKQIFKQASYSLELDNLQDSLNLYGQGFNQAIRQLSSYQFMHHYSQIIDKLNEKALSLLEKNRKTEAFSIVNQLIEWTQLKKQTNFYFVPFVQFPYMHQINVLNTQSSILIKQAKYKEAMDSSQQAIDIIHQNKVESVQATLLIAISRLNIAKALSKLQKHNDSIEYANQALNDFQNYFIQALNSESQQAKLIEYITETYLCLAWSEQQLKHYQGASFNYYQAKINAEKYLSSKKVDEIKTLYSQLMEEQKQKNKSGTNTSQKKKTSKRNLGQSQSKDQPFIDIVKSLENSGKLAQKPIKVKVWNNKRSQVKNKLKERQPRDYQNVQQGEQQEDIYKAKFMTISRLQEDLELTNVTKGQEVSQQNRYKCNIIEYLESILINKLLQMEQTFIEVQRFSNIILKAQKHDNLILNGTIGIYYLQSRNIVYLRYYAYQQYISDQLSQQRNEQYQRKVYGHSFNVSDISNLVEEQFLIDFLKTLFIEICRELIVNLDKQSLVFFNFTDKAGLYVQEYETFIQQKQKNAYESILFVSNECVWQEEQQQILQPLLCQQKNDDMNESLDEIKPLIYDQQKFEKITEVTESNEKTIRSNGQDQMQNDEELEDAAVKIQRVYKKKQEKKKNKNSLIINIGSEDSDHKITEVYPQIK